MGCCVVPDEERVMLSARVPKELAELVKADKRTNQEVLEAALWREFGGERKAAIERRMEEKKQRMSMIESERNERDRELEELEKELEALKTKREKLDESEAMNREAKLEKLKMVPDNPDHPLVQEVAEELEINPETAIEEANNL